MMLCDTCNIQIPNGLGENKFWYSCQHNSLFFPEVQRICLEKCHKTFIVNETIFVKWKLEIVKNNQDRKTIGFTDFSEDVQKTEKQFFLSIIGRSTNHFGSPFNISWASRQSVRQTSKQKFYTLITLLRIPYYSAISAVLALYCRFGLSTVLLKELSE